MISGFDNISLAVFTTLAPASTVAYICLACALLFSDKSSLANDSTLAVQKLRKYLALPLLVALVGFIASATHLGTPANALYVFAGVGRSPLSNEVLSIVIFLALAMTYWFMSIKRKGSSLIYRVWLVLSCIAGLVFIAMSAIAYSVETVPTWNLPFTAPSQWLFALIAGAVLAIVSTSLASLRYHKFTILMLVLASVAGIAGVIVLLLQNATLPEISNSVFTAAKLVPNFAGLIVVHAILALVALLVVALSLRLKLPRIATLVLQSTSFVLVSFAVFIMRLVFYDLHMTVGF